MKEKLDGRCYRCRCPCGNEILIIGAIKSDEDLTESQRSMVAAHRSMVAAQRSMVAARIRELEVDDTEEQS